MNSNHARYLTLVLMILTGISAAGPLTNTFPGLPAKYVPFLTLFILAFGEWLKAQLTPATNQHTPDNAPASPTDHTGPSVRIAPSPNKP